MDFLANLNGALQYIEENLADDIDLKEATRLACCSEYHFSRMFSFLAGITLRLTFQLTIQGGSAMNYRIIEKESFCIVGIEIDPYFYI